MPVKPELSGQDCPYERQPSVTGLRELKKTRTRASLREHALRLFRDQGYTATTVEQIAAAAEVSPSTFFRYFPTKEDLVLQDDMDTRMIEAFERQPPDLPPLAAMRAAIRETRDSYTDADLEQIRETTRLTMTVPEVRARAIDEFARTIQVIGAGIAKRAGRAADDLAVRVLAGAVVGVVMAVTLPWENWTKEEPEDFTATFTKIDEALGLLERNGFTLLPGSRFAYGLRPGIISSSWGEPGSLVGTGPAMGAHLMWSSALASHWRREVLRTSLWFVPAIEVVAAIGLFAVTTVLDKAAYHGEIGLPDWVISGTADAARQILTAIAAAVITVVGVVFSIILVTLTLASTQFGPRMLRNFIRDRGTQLTLGTFVATFVYSVLVLVSIGTSFVPHIGVTVTLGLMVADLAVLIYFIHHTAISIQLPQVIASIAADLTEAIEVQGGEFAATPGALEQGPSAVELVARTEAEGAVLLAPASGYLQFIKHQNLVRLAAEADAVITLEHRPGHFLVSGHRFATVWPPAAAPLVRHALGRAHLIGSHRTLTQDVSFGIDQLVEIAIRALSAAVNDTFTALTCIDWLGENLCKIVSQWRPARVHRDGRGYIRVIAAEPSYERLVQRSFEKIRQSSLGMPAVMIRLLEALARIMAETTTDGQRRVLLEQAAMIERASERSVPEAADRADVRRRYEAVITVESRVSAAVPGDG